MITRISPLAGQPAPASVLIEVGKLVAAYFSERPDPTFPAQQVTFGISGHRGSAFDLSFNEWHVLAITQAICDHRRASGITGPLFMGIDTHALSAPACASALEVLAANGVDAVLADGIVVTPSHNPPRDGGFKYNPPHRGPAGEDVTGPIQAAANAYLEGTLQGMRRMSHARALQAATTHHHDFLGNYVEDLDHVVDMAAISGSRVRIGIDPLGGAGVHYWGAIAARWKLNLTVVSKEVDPTFAFMTLDWDGQIRMDPSSPYAMQRLIAIKDRFDIAFACDTDHDRHGIVTPTTGLLPPNHFLCVAIDHLFNHRPQWGDQADIGKTVVSTQLIERLAKRLGRRVFEVPVGFKWFSPGLLDASLGFTGEESAGAAYLRRDGSAWTTDKDGLIAGLLAAKITACGDGDPGALYLGLAGELGSPCSDRVEAPATAQQKKRLSALSTRQIEATDLAGEQIERVINRAPGNDAPIGGIQVIAASGWYAARPSGTEDIYKIYAERFKDESHLRQILEEAQATVDAALAPGKHDRGPPAVLSQKEGS